MGLWGGFCPNQNELSVACHPAGRTPRTRKLLLPSRYFPNLVTGRTLNRSSQRDISRLTIFIIFLPSPALQPLTSGCLFYGAPGRAKSEG